MLQKLYAVVRDLEGRVVVSTISANPDEAKAAMNMLNERYAPRLVHRIVSRDVPMRDANYLSDYFKDLSNTDGE